MSTDRLRPTPSNPPVCLPEWHRIVANVVLDLAERHVVAVKDADPSAVLHPGRLVELVSNDATEATSDKPAGELVVAPDGEPRVTSAGMFRATLTTHVPDWSSPATRAEILGIVRATLDEHFGEQVERYRRAGIPADAALTTNRRDGR